MRTDGDLPRFSGRWYQVGIRLADGGECLCQTIPNTLATLEQGGPQLFVIPDQADGCLSQPLSCQIELPSCSKSAIAACSPNRTSGPYACSIRALGLSSLGPESCMPTTAPPSSRSSEERSRWRQDVA